MCGLSLSLISMPEYIVYTTSTFNALLSFLFKGNNSLLLWTLFSFVLMLFRVQFSSFLLAKHSSYLLWKSRYFTLYLYYEKRIECQYSCNAHSFLHYWRSLIKASNSNVCILFNSLLVGLLTFTCLHTFTKIAVDM